jgi:hypothetical protein
MWMARYVIVVITHGTRVRVKRGFHVYTLSIVHAAMKKVQVHYGHENLLICYLPVVADRTKNNLPPSFRGPLQISKVPPMWWQIQICLRVLSQV